MKIGVVGAPESGKSVYARKLATSIVKRGILDKRPKIIDGYVDDLAKRTDRAYGHLATYPLNFQVMFERWTRELEAEKEGRDSITCGTLYETMIYSAFHTMKVQDDIEERLQARAAMTAIGMFETLITNYDFLVYLPSRGIDSISHTYGDVVDRKIPEVLESYFKKFIDLRNTNQTNEVKFTTDVIQKYLTQDEQPPV